MRVSTIALAALVGLSPLWLGAAPGHAGKKGTAAFIGGAIVGGAIVGALSNKHRHDKVIYVPGYQPYPPGGYDPVWAGTVSPKPGVSCYPAQQACYNAKGAYSPKWTWQVYGR